MVGGRTSKESANAFVRVSLEGLEDVFERMRQLGVAISVRQKQEAVRRASRPILEGYKELARRHEATGNLARSTKTIVRDYRNGDVAVAVTGPEQTGPVGATAKRASGNHSWLVEFGSGPRKPGSQNRRAYINVHQSINRKMHRHSSANDEQFSRMGRGYYFLMGSINEPTRQSGGRAGYSRDFMLGTTGRSGRQHPITLGPNDTIAPMPGLHLMQKTIDRKGAQVRAILEAELISLINQASR
jgi:hypothetical protein